MTNSQQHPRLLPLRDYSEHDVINLFSFDGETVEAGTFVKVSSSDGSKDPVELQTSHGQWSLNFPNLGNSAYPVAPNKIALASSGARKHDVLGITLYDQKTTDENGEKYLFNPQKASENRVILTGQAMPVLTRGLVKLATGAYVGSPDAVTNKYGVIDNANGKVNAYSYATLTGAGYTMDNVVGTFLGTPASGAQQTSGVLFKLGL